MAAKRRKNPKKRRNPARRAAPAPQASNPRRKRRASKRRRTVRTVYVVSNPAGKKGNPKRRRSRRRRRNPSFGDIPWKDFAIAGASAVAALYGGTKLAEMKLVGEDTMSDPKKAALVMTGFAVAGGALTYVLSGNAPAAIGAVAGLGGLAIYSAVVREMADKPTTTASMGAVDYHRLGAVRVDESGMGAVYGGQNSDGYAPVSGRY